MTSKTSEPTDDQPSAPATVETTGQLIAEPGPPENTEHVERIQALESRIAELESAPAVPEDPEHAERMRQLEAQEIDRMIVEHHKIDDLKRAIGGACTNEQTICAIKEAVLYQLEARDLDMIHMLRQLTNDPTFGITIQELDQAVEHECLLGK